MENTGSHDTDSCASSLSGYHSDRSSVQQSQSPSQDSWISWGVDGGSPDAGWPTGPHDTPSPPRPCSRISFDSGACESDAGSSSPSSSSTDGWSSDTSNPTDDACGPADSRNDQETPADVFDQVPSPRSPKNPADLRSSDLYTGRLAAADDDASQQNESLAFFRRRPRKQRCPEKSADRFDPGFKGVILKFKTKIDSRNWRSRLRISSYFSCHRRTRSCRYHRHENKGKFLIGADSTSSSDSGSDLVVPKKGSNRLTGKTGKQCASCGTKKTPLWRDAEDGTPLCNACGIRYKKYRIRCTHCWYVPRKSGKSYPVCSSCGERVQASHARKMAPFVITTKFGKFYNKQL